MGGGPAGAATSYWLAEAGHDVVMVEKKVFPREKTCGDGLTPRAVRQLEDMGLTEQLRDYHRYDGLRAVAHGITLDLTCDVDLRDASGRPLSGARVTAVLQDEPVNGKGDGNTAPDAEGVGASTLRLRAERAGPGDGRIYEVQLSATDADGNPVQHTLTIGIPLNRTPVAVKIALLTAGAIPTIGVSPAPIGATSSRLTITTSILGVSLNRGTRYCQKCGFVIRPLSNSSASYSAPPRPITIEPSIWFLRCSGLMIAPHSNPPEGYP